MGGWVGVWVKWWVVVCGSLLVVVGGGGWVGGVLCAWWCVVWRVHGCVFARQEQKSHEDQEAKKVLHDLSRSAKNPDVFYITST